MNLGHANVNISSNVFKSLEIGKSKIIKARKEWVCEKLSYPFCILAILSV